MELSAIRALSKRRSALVVLCGLLLGACATQRTPEQVEELLSRGVEAAGWLYEAGLDEEAAVLIDAMERVDADYPRLHDFDPEIDPEVRERMQRGVLGMNRRIRPPIERSPHTRVLLWLPDRLLDLLDVVSVGVHFGLGAFADAHVTRALQVSGGARTTGGVGLHDFRSIGMKSQAEAGLTAVALGAQTYGGSLVGTSGARGAAASLHGLHSPTEPLYQEFRDYWALGASATAAIVGLEIDFHPLQLVDFLAGVVGVDFLNDDLARTRRLKFDTAHWKLLSEIQRVQRSSSTVAAYQESRRLESQRLAPETPSPRPPHGQIPAAPAP